VEQGVLIRDCSNYSGLRKGYYRVAVKLHEQNEKLIEVLEEVLS
jgi:threonine-phosphate decarboxylase